MFPFAILYFFPQYVSNSNPNQHRYQFFAIIPMSPDRSLQSMTLTVPNQKISTKKGAAVAEPFSVFHRSTSMIFPGGTVRKPLTILMKLGILSSTKQLPGIQISFES